jgi:hypothetical protein
VSLGNDPNPTQTHHLRPISAAQAQATESTTTPRSASPNHHAQATESTTRKPREKREHRENKGKEKEEREKNVANEKKQKKKKNYIVGYGTEKEIVFLIDTELIQSVQ